MADSNDLAKLVCQATEHDWKAMYGGIRGKPVIAEKCSRCQLLRTWKPFINTMQVRLTGEKPPLGVWEYEQL